MIYVMKVCLRCWCWKTKMKQLVVNQRFEILDNDVEVKVGSPPWDFLIIRKLYTISLIGNHYFGTIALKVYKIGILC